MKTFLTGARKDPRDTDGKEFIRNKAPILYAVLGSAVMASSGKLRFK